MALELKYDERLAGAKAVATRNGAQLTTGVRDFGTVYMAGKNDYTFLTGYYYFVNDLIYAQTTGGLYLINPNGTDWEFTANAIGISTHSQSQAQQLVDKIIRNNIQILQNNLVCARYANLFTASQQAQIRELQERLQKRNEALQAEGLTASVKTSYPAGYSELQPYLDKLMAGGGVGVATWVVIVIAAAVIAGMGTAAYYAYKSFADESEKDVKFSKELTAILAQKLTPAEYQQLLNETKGIVTKARIKQAAGSYWNVLKYAAFAAAGFVGYKLIQRYVVS